MEDTFGKRLRNARMIRCLTQGELSDRLDGKISVDTIEKYESGQQSVSSSHLILLMKALDFNTDYFYRPFTEEIDAEHIQLRGIPGLTPEEMESVKLYVVSEVEKYLEIENILDIDNPFYLDYRDYQLFETLSVQCEQDAKEAALSLREDLQLGMYGIPSVRELLESKGVKIIEVEGGDKLRRTSGKLGDVAVIVIHKDMSVEDKRLAILVELAFLILNFSNDFDPIEQEALCYAFALEMLIPSDRFLSIIGESRKEISLVEMQSLQRQYGISVDALMTKAYKLNIIGPSKFRDYNQKMENLPQFQTDVEKSLYHADKTSRFERLVYTALAEELISFSKAVSLLEIPEYDLRKTMRML